jgi:hypothetical protein
MGSGMTSSSDDLYSQLFDQWQIERRAAIAKAEERDNRENEQQVFRTRWETAYGAYGTLAAIPNIADQLLALRSDILSRFWDFHLSALYGTDKFLGWNLAAITLWHVSRGDRAAIQKGLAHTAILLNDISIHHSDMYAVLSCIRGLPYTPPLTQMGLARLIDKKRYDVNNWCRHSKLTTQDATGNAKRWLHIDCEVQKSILIAIREKKPQLIWPHGNT